MQTADMKKQTNNDSNDNEKGEEESLPELYANYEIEEFTYYRERINNCDDIKNDDEEEAVIIKIKYATTTRGRQIVHESKDSTGIMLWPASRIMCQFIAWISSSSSSSSSSKHNYIGDTVLEVGCGCGVVSVLAAKLNLVKFIVCTDFDTDALKLSDDNMQLNNLDQEQEIYYGNDDKNDTEQDNKTIIKSYPLTWGSVSDVDQVLKLMNNCMMNNTDQQEKKFDTILGADIVYPRTSDELLHELFASIKLLLKKGKEGKFILSFVSRDGPLTPLKLIRAASQAGFYIDHVISEQSFCSEKIKKRLPPTMESKLLVLVQEQEQPQYNENGDIVDAASYNSTLGSDECHVFPGLDAAIERQNQQSDSDEEWQAPFFEESDTEDE